MLEEIWRFWKRYRNNATGVFGLVIIVLFLIIALFADMIAPADPFKITSDSFFAPSLKYLFGTDDLGRDIFSGVVYGSRISLLVGLLTAIASTIIGLAIGGISGYFGGKIDDVLMRLTEFFQVIPRFFLALVLIALFGSSIWNLILVLTILTWAFTARLFRADVLSLRSRDFVTASRALGSNEIYIIFVEILPNALAPIIVNTSVQIAHAIIVEAGLSFLGLGDLSKMSWGVMLCNAQPFLRKAWWLATFPGMAIFLTVLGFNLVGDGLNDALNPRLKYQRTQLETIR